MNGLMRRLDTVQREKGRIIVELEREEEMLTNTLQRRLNEVRKEKALLEQQIEREHEEQARLARRVQDATVSDAATSVTTSSDSGAGDGK
jgi:predicted nuclease with TOPRIM domain